MADDIQVSVTDETFNISLPVGVSPPVALNDLTDVDTLDSQNDYVLVQTAPDTYSMQAVPRLDTALNDLTDVTTAGDNNFVFTKISDTEFGFRATQSVPTALNDLTDVVSAGTIRNTLYGLQKGSDDIFILTSVPEDRFVRFLGDIEDVSVGSAQEGQVLTRVGASYRFTTVQGGGGGGFDPTLDYVFYRVKHV